MLCMCGIPLSCFYISKKLFQYPLFIVPPFCSHIQLLLSSVAGWLLPLLLLLMIFHICTGQDQYHVYINALIESKSDSPENDNQPHLNTTFAYVIQNRIWLNEIESFYFYRKKICCVQWCARKSHPRLAKTIVARVHGMRTCVCHACVCRPCSYVRFVRICDDWYTIVESTYCTIESVSNDTTSRRWMDGWIERMENSMSICRLYLRLPITKIKLLKCRPRIFYHSRFICECECVSVMCSSILHWLS